MEKLHVRVDVLKQLIQIAAKVLVRDRVMQPSTIRTYYGKHLFNRISLGVKSILDLINAGLSEDEEIYRLDVSSIASLTRDLIEAYTVFRYLCVERVNAEELDFRLNLMSFHHGYDVIKLSRLFGFDEDDKIHNTMYLQQKFSAIRLEKNAVFNALDSKTQKRLLDGEKAYYRGQNSKMKIGSLSPQIESGIYRLLSTSVHALPLGVSNSSEGLYPGHPHFDQINLLFLSVEVASLYFASTIKSYINLRRNLAKSIDIDEKKYIKEILEIKLIDKWVQLRKEYVESYYGLPTDKQQ